jgi:hypothetical protein
MIDVYGDSILITCQVKGKGQTKDEKLGPYQEYLSKLTREFKGNKVHSSRKGRKPFCCRFGHASFYG